MRTPMIFLCSICMAEFKQGDPIVIPHRGKYRAEEHNGHNSGYHPQCWRFMMSLPAATDQPKFLDVKPDFSPRNRQLPKVVNGTIPAHWN